MRQAALDLGGFFDSDCKLTRLSVLTSLLVSRVLHVSRRSILSALLSLILFLPRLARGLDPLESLPRIWLPRILLLIWEAREPLLVALVLLRLGCRLCLEA